MAKSENKNILILLDRLKHMWSSSLVLMARLAGYLGSLQIWFMFRHIVLNMRFVFESNKNNVVLYCYKLQVHVKSSMTHK